MCTQSITSNCIWNHSIFVAIECHLVWRTFKGALEFYPQYCILPNAASATCRIKFLVLLICKLTLLRKFLIEKNMNFKWKKKVPVLIFSGASSKSISMSNEKIDWRNDLLVILTRIVKTPILLREKINFSNTKCCHTSLQPKKKRTENYTQNMVFSLFFLLFFCVCCFYVFLFWIKCKNSELIDLTKGIFESTAVSIA